MRIVCLRTGLVREREGERGARRYLWAGWRDDALPVNAFLVDHPAGLCLFDAGQTARATTRGYFPRWQPFFRLARFELDAEDEVGAQLEPHGRSPADIRWVVLSHLHTDHVGGLAPFSRSEVLVSRTEWERAQGVGGRARGYLPQHWPREIVPSLLDLDGAGFGPFPAAHLLVDDETLVIVATHGHTPGHVGLLVRRPEGDVLLGGDLAHTRAELARVAPAVADYCARHGIAYVGAHDRDAESSLEPAAARAGGSALAAGVDAREG
jgi:glyoxylase-like metal-dependent hydrolase (beta-lactamase superfamily II)